MAFKGLESLCLDWTCGWDGGMPCARHNPPKIRASCPGPVVILPSFPSPQKWTEPRVTSTDDSDPWWAAFSGVFKDM